ncbi:hypothetical protein AAEU28_12765 [Pseudoalteromonas sp. SS15]|uniref:hypothetical protein n=1 Tax=Pseudoalteromonas sp. SS15 TaxID=3139393 RepID=UPI003BA9978A
MIKLTSIALLAGCLVGCAYTAQPTQASAQQSSQREITKQIKQALEKNDYRLLALASRRLVFPGLEQEDSATLKTICGVRYVDNSTDIIKNTEDKQKRRDAYAFAKSFNLAILKHCLNSASDSKYTVE